MSKSDSEEAQSPRTPATVEAAQKGEARKPDHGKTDGQIDPFYLHQLFDNAHGYFASQQPSLKSLSERCVFVLDTNVLLALYRVGKTPIANVAEIFKKLSADSRLFVPERALREFLKNRHIVVKEAFDLICTTKKRLAEISAVVSPMLEGIPEYNSLQAEYEKFKSPKADYVKALSAIEELLTDWGWDDGVSKLLATVITVDRVLKNSQKKDESVADLNWRITHKIPPGYKDAHKIDSGIGDMLIWHSLLEFANAKKCDVIFVTNDEKPDWVISTQDTAIMPRPELCGEFYSRTGKHFGMVVLSKFLRLMNAQLATVEAAEKVEVVADKAPISFTVDTKASSLQRLNSRLLQLAGRLEQCLVSENAYEMTLSLEEPLSKLLHFITKCLQNKAFTDNLSLYQNENYFKIRHYMSVVHESIKALRGFQSDLSVDVRPLKNELFEAAHHLRGYIFNIRFQ
jgi:predicted nucleic-acid-binding protein